ncbi:MAG: lipid A phosphoethanolamine transferase [Paramuribaculum sp.]|nr:lipid A phosphoethanolamine transferase [Paramuribaculum sp.]
MKHSDQYDGRKHPLMVRLLLIWVTVSCTVPNIWLSFTERMPLFQSITNVLLPAGLYALLMSLTRRIGRSSLWMIILFVFAAFQLVLLYMYGRSVIAVDMFLNVVTTNPTEVNELLSNLFVVILLAVIIYLPPIVCGIVAAIGRWRLSAGEQRATRRTGLVLVAAGVITMCCGFAEKRSYNPLHDIYPANIAYNLVTAVVRTFKVVNYHDTSAGFTYDATSTRADSIPELYVLVIGETSRADNWQLCGYDRPTTPALAGRDGLVSFRRAISQSNTTHKAVPMLLSPLDAETFTDSIYHVKSMITAFKEAGFATSYISNQSRNHSLIDFFGEEADTCIFLADNPRSDGEHHYDSELVNYLRDALCRGKGKQLVVLHTYGSHFNYIDRYPQEQAAFSPDRPARATVHFRDKQINAYDNTILYTSNFLGDIIDLLDERGGNAVMVYTSDHGEDIFDDERNLFLHASPIPSYYQLHVPFVVWMNAGYRGAYPEIEQALAANSDKFVASSMAFFHTVMDMAGISTKYADEKRSVASAKYTPERAMYLNDHNDGVPLSDCGILHYDTERLDSLSIPLCGDGL